MKKILLIVLAFLLCLTLAACKEEPMPTETTVSTQTTGTTQTGATDATDATEKPSITTGFVEVPKPDTLPTSGWIVDTPITSDPYALTEEGFYHLTNNCLCYTDIATGYTVYLCSKPGCLHGEAESGWDRRKCDAFISGGSVNIMFAYGDSLYYANHDHEGTYSLRARNLDGTGLRDVYTLCSAFASPDTSVLIHYWAMAYGDLYYSVDVTRVIDIEQNSSTYEQAMKALVRYDLDTGKEEILLCVEDSFLGIVGVHEDMAVVWMSHIPTEEEWARPDYAEYMKQFPAYLRLWKEGAGGISTLCEMETNATNTSVGIAGGKVHQSGGSGTKKYAYDLATGTFGDSDLPEGVSRIWNEKYAGVGWKNIYDLETGAYLTNEYGTMQLPADIQKFGASVEIIGKHGIVLKESYSQWREGENYGVTLYSYYSYIPFDKLSDGMQLSDRLVFKLHDMRPADDTFTLIQPEA